MPPIGLRSHGSQLMCNLPETSAVDHVGKCLDEGIESTYHSSIFMCDKRSQLRILLQ